MSRCLELNKGRIRHLVSHVFANLHRRDDVFGTLQDQRRCASLCQVGSVVAPEGQSREMPGDLWVRSAETLAQRVRQFWTLGVTHDRGCHLTRPTEIVGLHGVDQPFDILFLEPSEIAFAVVQVASRRADKDQLSKEVSGVLPVSPDRSARLI